jgi:hypothetical protein
LELSLQIKRKYRHVLFNCSRTFSKFGSCRAQYVVNNCLVRTSLPNAPEKTSANSKKQNRCTAQPHKSHKISVGALEEAEIFIFISHQHYHNLHQILLIH